MAKRIGLGVLGVLVLALVGIQLVPVDRSNPEVTGEIEAPAEVMKVLRASCYDCHSNETNWPWYSYVAPVSWLVAHDVEEGREHLNFSTWNQAGAGQQDHYKEEIWEEVEHGNMPLDIYVAMHSEAALTGEERDVLRTWAGE